MASMKQAHMAIPAQISAPPRAAETPVWFSDGAKSGAGLGMLLAAGAFPHILSSVLFGGIIGYGIGVWAAKHDRAAAAKKHG